MHGAGGGAPRGNKNALKHDGYTLEAIAQGRALRAVEGGEGEAGSDLSAGGLSGRARPCVGRLKSCIYSGHNHAIRGMAKLNQDLPQRRARRIISGAAHPARSRKCHGRNSCAHGVRDIAAGGWRVGGARATAANYGISTAAPIAVPAVAIARIGGTRAVEIESAAITEKVRVKENKGAAVESERAIVETAGLKADLCASRISRRSEQDRQQRETGP